MIDPPAWLMDVYRSGRCRNATQLYELRRLHEADSQRVEKRLEGLGRIGSGYADRLKKADYADEGKLTKEHSPPDNAGVEFPGLGKPASRARSAPPREETQESLILRASYQGTSVRLQLGALPSRRSAVFISSLSTGKRLVSVVDVFSKLANEVLSKSGLRFTSQVGSGRPGP